MTCFTAKPCKAVLTAFALCAMAIPQNAMAQLGGVGTPSFMNSKPAALRPAYEKLIAGGARDSVLNNMEIAGIALRLQDYREAADAIDRALLDITRYYGQTQAAANARSLWHEEGAKEFKGEPYERAMAHYYRGMLDMRLGDYGNAQASFQSGLIQDAFAEEEQNRADFALLAFLAAWALDKNDNTVRAEDYYKDLAYLRPDFERPPKNHDTLVVVETGKSPRKLADGIGHAELVYRRGKKFKDQTVLIEADQQYPAYLMEDIYYQARTRGARPVDRILDGKIKFRNDVAKSGAQTAHLGEIASTAAFLSDSSEMGYAGSGLKVLGALQMFTASNTKPRADTRYWPNLPDRIHIFTYDSTQLGAESVRIHYLDAAENVLEDMSITVPRLALPNRSGLVWVLPQH